MPALVEVAFDNIVARMRTSDPGVYDEMDRLLRYHVPGFQWMPKYKSHKWDGMIHLFHRRDNTFPSGLVRRVKQHFGDDHTVRLYDRRAVPAPDERLSEGQSTTTLRESQQAAVVRARESGRGVFEAATGWGKALDCNTPVPTPAGWTVMGALRAGDRVFDDQGRPCRVTFTTGPQMDRPCYEMRFSDDEVLVADAEHRWLTWDAGARQAFQRAITPNKKPGVRTTEELATSLRRYGKNGTSNHSIVLCAPLQFPAKTLPIPPYLLGVWLGDGTASAASFCCYDQDLLSLVRCEALALNSASDQHQYRLQLLGTRRNDGFQSRLCRLGLLNNKHIPPEYLEASVAQRMALLQGLMDTDGTVSTTGSCSFDNTNKALIGGVRLLLCGLGIKVAQPYAKQAKLRGRNCSLSYRLNFTTEHPVFRLPSKIGRQRTARVRPTQRWRYIKAIHPTASVPVCCIAVDSPSHLYLVGRACIPTHNTCLMGSVITLQAVPALILVHRRELAYQTLDRFEQTLRFPRCPVGERLFGIVGDNIFDPGIVTIATYQTVYSMLGRDKKGTLAWLAQFKALHIDEAHHVPARTLYAVCNAAKDAFYRFGYCVAPETKILTADLRWVDAGELKVGDALVGFEEEGLSRHPRSLSPAQVTATGRRWAHCYRIRLDTGQVLTCSAEHPWLVYPYPKNQTVEWKTAEQLAAKKGPIRARMPHYFSVWPRRATLEAGYVAGMFDGEGSRKLRNGRMVGLSITQADNPAWQYVLRCLEKEGIHYTTPPNGDVKGLHVACLPFHSMVRLLGSTRPPRLLQVWARSRWPSLYPEGRASILAIEDAGWREVVGLSTSTGTYIAEGFGSHNSATPFKSDKSSELRLVSVAGEIIFSFGPQEAIQEGILVPPKIYMLDCGFPYLDGNDRIEHKYIYGWSKEYREGVVEHIARNKIIARCAEEAAAAKQPTLVLLQHLAQGRNILRYIDEGAEFCHGSHPMSVRKRALKRLGQGQLPILLSSVIMEEGVDLPALGMVIMAGGYRAKHKALQRIGRGLRASPGKSHVVVIDFCDLHSERLAKHARSRMSAYRGVGFEVEVLTPEALWTKMAESGFWGSHAS